MSSGNMEVARYWRGPSFLEDHRLVGKVDGEDMDVGEISLRKNETSETHSQACGHWLRHLRFEHTFFSELFTIRKYYWVLTLAVAVNQIFNYSGGLSRRVMS
jgi:hypothetical protein